MDYLSWPLTQRNKNAIAAFLFLYSLLLVSPEVFLLTIVIFTCQEIVCLFALFLADELGKLKELA